MCGQQSFAQVHIQPITLQLKLFTRTLFNNGQCLHAEFIQLYVSIVKIISYNWMQLYNLALQPSTAIIKAVYGSFSGLKVQQIILAKTKSIELHSINSSGKLELMVVEELFCIIRTIVSFRFHAINKDLVMIGSDSGKVIILEYNSASGRFVKTHEECFGKSGCRRVVAGQYIAVDPRGKAFMIAAIERQKFVYTLNRENEKLMISSPRQAHKSQSICGDLVALDVGNQNAMFVCLEMGYGQGEEKEAKGEMRKWVAYYEMDFGMNTVIRKKEVPVDWTAHMLIAVPDTPEGPGGLIVLLEDYLIYRNTKAEHLVKFPTRQGSTARKTQFTTHATYRHKGTFFFLIASELGDIFKVEFMLKEHTILKEQTREVLKEQTREVVSIKIEYFDTVSCLTSMCLTKSGYLFCASEKQDHCLFSFLERKNKVEIYTHSQMANNSVVTFSPHLEPDRQLMVEDRLEQFGPATDLKVADLKGEGNPQIYMINASGGSGKSYLRVIKQGLKVRELHTVKYTKGQEIWSVKGSYEDEEDKMIIISLAAKTIVLSVVENGFALTKDTGIEEDTATVHVGRLHDSSLVQIVPNGFKHLKRDKLAKVTKLEGKIIRAVTRGGQMVIALAGGDIYYYELDETGNLSEVACETNLDSEVVAMDLAPIEKGRVRSTFLVAGFTDFTTRIFELARNDKLHLLSTQNMKTQIESIVVEEMHSNNEQNNNNSNYENENNNNNYENNSYSSQLYMYTGLSNGLLFRTSLDTITGKLSDTRSKYLGSRPVKCIKIKILNKPAILALSSRPWLIYNYCGKQITTLLAFPYLDIACPVVLQKYKHSIIGYCENHLKVITLETFGNIFHSEKIQLQYSAKKMMLFKNRIAIIESQYEYPTQNSQMEEDDNPKAKKYKSQVQIFNPNNQKNLITQQFQPNQVCLSMCYCQTEPNSADGYILFGFAKNLSYHPKMEMQQAYIKVYLWKNQALTFVYKTVVEGAPLVLHTWNDKVLAGIGNCLRAYQIGKKQLLKKAELKNLSSSVNTIKTIGQRIYTTQVCDSFHLYKFRDQTFYEVADDILPRYMTSSAILDYNTIIGGDKFQNIFVSRVPQNAQEEVENNPNAYKFRWEYGYLNGAPFKMEQICSFYCGEVITSIEKSSLATTGSQIVIYSTINGGIGALCPFEVKEDVDFFSHLEMYMRNLTSSLGGRDHLMYRSYYSPCRAIVDGDLCEVYMKLTYQQQLEIAKHLDRNPQQIHKKLEQMRNRLI